MMSRSVWGVFLLVAEGVLQSGIAVEVVVDPTGDNEIEDMRVSMLQVQRQEQRDALERRRASLIDELQRLGDDDVPGDGAGENEEEDESVQKEPDDQDDGSEEDQLEASEQDREDGMHFDIQSDDSRSGGMQRSEELDKLDRYSSGLQCTGYPTWRGNNKQKCEGGNQYMNGWMYVYNEHRGKWNAECGQWARCWCCRKKVVLIDNSRILSQPSNAPEFTFYAYQAKQGADLWSLDNNNVATLGGVLWYLHNEVIQTCSGSGYLSKGKWGDRKFGIDHIRRIKITVKATTPLLNKGLKWGPLKGVDMGEITGPHRMSSRWGGGTGHDSDAEWAEFGHHVGCAPVGDWPHTDFKTGKNYPDAIWYSLIGACPGEPRNRASSQCKQRFPGGHCNKADGRGTCTYSYEEAGVINIDELVGIRPRWRTRRDFCSQCHSEGSPWNPGGCGLSFWGQNIYDRNANAARAERVKDAFKKKFPNMPRDMPAPPCDFDRKKYGI
eukprot:TRINITY_DN10240_c0_g3_i1.p1 TRINITY_DN10240_c0_g3~~TRINITY_DN10240_c0_g3_i1.p1  ORF type:complete len:515 (+),score=80.15 TRINITY_DN10240_c0_g3_i1:63-1547(+)